MYIPKLSTLLLSGIVSALVATALGAVEASEKSRVREEFNQDWRFHKGDPEGSGDPFASVKINDWLAPQRARLEKQPKDTKRPGGNLGENLAYLQSSFDDTSWRKLNLPHDWGIEGPFKQEYPADTGKLPWWGVAWYRKTFEVHESDRGKRLFLDFDGAMSHPLVWVNGRFAGGWRYGYTSFRVDVTPYLDFGGKNVVAVRLDNPEKSSRWYPGGGIYRNVWLVKTPPVHVAHWGTQLTTSMDGAKSATVGLKTTIDNTLATPAKVAVKTEIFALNEKGKYAGPPVASISSSEVEISAAGTGTIPVSLKLPDPKLWSPATPHRYVAVSVVQRDGKPEDIYETPFGIRTVKFTPNEGMLLNGEVCKLKGVCNHHDLGVLGAAINIRAMERQVELLKEMGCNAIRTAHNPPAPELLDICDRLGMLVQVEAFDSWWNGKKPNDYSKHFGPWHEADLRAMVRRDRNHPSVIMWSTGNEVVEQSGPGASSKLTAIVNDEDPTRLVSVGCHYVEAGFNGFQTSVGAFGFNYKPWAYERFHKENPDIPVYGSETASTVSSRGEYFFPLGGGGNSNFQVSSYDLYFPGWAMIPDKEFAAQDKNPFVAGEFVWTGFDYLGEPTPYNKDSTNLLNMADPVERERLKVELEKLGKIAVPSRSSYFGILDLAGFKKDRFFIYQAKWLPDLPMAHLLPHWNWPERVGQVTPVHLYTSGDEAELFLNGKSLGRQKKESDQYRLRWDKVKYESGELKAVVYKNGKPWAEDAVRTTGAASKVTLEPDRKEISADGRDLSFVTVRIDDKDGTMVPRSKNLVKFEITGPGEIAAVDNGDPTSHDSFQAKERKAFNGLALVIVRSKPGEAGKVQLKASSDGLTPATTLIETK